MAFKIEYNMDNLIIDLKCEVTKLLMEEGIKFEIGIISDADLSRLLGYKSSHIKGKKELIKRKPICTSILSPKNLDTYLLSLKLRFGERCIKIIKLIQRFRKLNTYVPKLRIYDYHPKFKINYFKKIDIKQKSYWLGFLFADGFIIRNKNNNEKFRIGIELSIKDEILVKRFVKALGLNPSYIKTRTRKLNYEGEIREYKMIYIRFNNKEMAEDLKKLGMKERKYDRIELPNFGVRELDLAFLLGFYDGDGKSGETQITSSSKKFIEQVREKYKIKNKLNLDGKYWRLHLSSNLMNEMMENFGGSLERKRKIFVTKEMRIEALIQSNKERRKIIINEGFLQEFQNLLLRFKIEDLADYYNISARTVSRIISKCDLKTLPNGYWKAKLKLGIFPIYFE